MFLLKDKLNVVAMSIFDSYVLKMKTKRHEIITVQKRFWYVLKHGPMLYVFNTASLANLLLFWFY